ncbi:MAG: hypothetical protein ACYCTI_10540 [Acidimicrobiales bacterium]
MAKEKVTITLDRAKASAACELVGTGIPLSRVIDLALDRLIRAERLRSDVAAYRSHPQTAKEDGIAASSVNDDLADGTDWEALYPEQGS